MYHSIGLLGEDPVRICTSPERFEAQMGYLRRRNLRGVSVGELRRAAGSAAAGRLVGLTFDDAYEDFLSEAVPILERHGFTATVFAPAGRLGGFSDWSWDEGPSPRLRLLGPDGLREAAGRGMEVGSHTFGHVRLAGLGPDRLDKEVNRSRELLGEVLGDEVGGFSYPYGSVDRAAVDAVRSAGYAYACATPPRTEWRPYALPRIPVADNDGPFRFAAKIGLYRGYAAAKAAFSGHPEGVGG